MSKPAMLGEASARPERPMNTPLLHDRLTLKNNEQRPQAVAKSNQLGSPMSLLGCDCADSSIGFHGFIIRNYHGVS